MLTQNSQLKLTDNINEYGKPINNAPIAIKTKYITSTVATTTNNIQSISIITKIITDTPVHVGDKIDDNIISKVIPIDNGKGKIYGYEAYYD